jgi:ABC-type uncharacterized transport system permease subunit
MDDAALHQRLSRLERRLTLTLALVVGLYLLGGVTAVVWIVPGVTPWHGAISVVALGLVAVVVGMARRRRARV